jgi:hypothetical protein
MSRPLLITLAICTLAACADKIDHEHPDAAPSADAPAGSGSGDAPPVSSAKVATTRGSDGTYTTIVDSTSMTDWVYADFETGTAVADTAAWDLRFQRFDISSNSGVSGSGGVQVAALTNTTFAAVTSAPADGYLVDAADGNGDGMPDYAFEQGDGWYDYDPTTHVLTPKPIVWVVKTDGGATLKLEIVKYYDDAGTSGWFTLHWNSL